MTFRPQNRASEAEKLLARFTRYAGHSTAAIGRVLGRSHATICYWTDDNYNARKKAANLARYHAEPDPAKKRRRGPSAERNKLRKYARMEATATGQPVAAIYERWGCP